MNSPQYVMCFDFPSVSNSLVRILPNSSVSGSGLKVRSRPLNVMRSSAEFRIPRRVRTSMMQENGENEEKKDPSGGEPRDWDSSWNDYQQKRNGGVFKLPDQTTNKTQDMIDERTDRITSIWANENGFLLAIGVILLIAAFYGYVYATGGISH
ncbi:hypothetical protein FGB62_22g340 [Gracilaria domingensis]|nr:hypothetical protein FGB62_22g340 [Gracilaria domingensis]